MRPTRVAMQAAHRLSMQRIFTVSGQHLQKEARLTCQRVQACLTAGCQLSVHLLTGTEMASILESLAFPSVHWFLLAMKKEGAGWLESV